MKMEGKRLLATMFTVIVLVESDHGGLKFIVR